MRKMTKEEQTAMVLNLMKAASDDQPIPDGPHVLDDEELVACWENNLITSKQREEIIAHLADCPLCRRELAEMMEEGLIEFSQLESDQESESH